MKISARNQFAGTVNTVTDGAVMSEVVVDIAGGNEVVAIFKSTEVMLAVDD
jgi:molybdate transport system regulatory protein